MIYADNAATTKLDEEAFEAMIPYLKDNYGNPSQPYSFSRITKKALKKAREIIAKCINAQPEEIIFTSGGTESDNWAIKSNIDVHHHKQIITSEIEHHAVLNSCLDAERLGDTIKYAKVDRNGVVLSDDIEHMLNENTRLVSVMLANNEIGTIEPIKKIAKLAHQYGSLVHTDAVQAVGHISIDVNELGVDLMAASAHKFNGPRGVGFIYVRKGTKLNPFITGGAQESNMRAGTENVANIVGMAKALENNCKNLKSNQEYIIKLENVLIESLKNNHIDFIRNGSDKHLPGNMSLSFRGFEGEMLLHRLDLMGICVSTGSACDSKNTQISHVLKAINLDEDYALGTIRVSLGKNNTEEEAVKIAHAISKIIKSKKI